MKKSRRKRRAWHAARMGQKRNAHCVLVGKTKGNKSLGRQKKSADGRIILKSMTKK
jgi:hypothetical protein